MDYLPIARVAAACAGISTVVVARRGQQWSSIMQIGILIELLLLLLVMPGVMGALCITARIQITA